MFIEWKETAEYSVRPGLTLDLYLTLSAGLHALGDMTVRTLASVLLIEIIIQFSSVDTRGCNHGSYSV